MRRGLMLLLPLTLSLPGCGLFAVGRPIVNAQSVGCSDLVDEWMKPVAGAPLPTGGTVADWQVFGDQQTGNLDMANDRIVNGHATIKRCEQRDREAVARATRRRIL
jgi:hypothetical protein